MPSSYTPSLKLVLPVTGELANSWGNTVNTELTSLVDIAVAGYLSVAMTDADLTLTNGDGAAANQARYMSLNITGTLTASRNVICPTASKLFYIKNATTGGFAITLKTSGGSGVSIPNGASMVLLCNGVNVVDAVTQFSAGSFTNLAYTGTLTGGTGIVNLGSGQFYKDASGNVGIGAIPTNKLDVVQAAGNGGITYRSSTRSIGIGQISSEAAIFWGSTTDLTFSSGGLEKMRLTYGGNLGIGTASPTQKLSVAGTFSATGAATIQTLTVGLGAGSFNTTNTALGVETLKVNTTGIDNTAVGNQALIRNTTGLSNTAIGSQALFSNTDGFDNTAIGGYALYSNTSGDYNIAIGGSALEANTTGNNNTALGFTALGNNTSGNNNIAIGYEALTANINGSNNVSVGFQTLLACTAGSNNVAIGFEALQANTTGSGNTASGYATITTNTTGSNNTASGNSALYFNVSGSNNSAFGNSALLVNTGSNNTGIGYNALNNNTSGSGNIAIGPVNSAGTYAPVFNPITENNRLCLGSTGVTNAYVQVAWTVVSDARDKTDFAPVPHGLAFVNALQPTAYRYKMNREDVSGHGPIRYGFLAQEVLALEGDSPVIVDIENTEKLRFNDQSMIAVLVNAIQELKAEFDAYKASHP